MRIFCKTWILVLSTFALLSTDISPSYAGDTNAGIDSLITGAIRGKETGLALPRFVSLKAKRTNMRVGPSFDHRISWVYVKPGIPVEVIQEFEVWRRIRDVDGEEGWVHKAMLSGNRKAIVAPNRKGQYFSIHKKPSETSPATAKLQSGVYAEILECHSDWCRLRGRNYRGWVKADVLWGVYDGENVE